MPRCYSTKEALEFIPNFVEQPLRILKVLDPERIKRCLSEDEHIYRFSNMSAFNENTIQDAKYHKLANELYYVVEGQVSVKWKHISDGEWNSELLIANENKRWIHIPPLHCLFLQKHTSSFLAVAYKTEESTKANKNKIQGNYCEIKACKEREECIKLQENREDFFRILKGTDIQHGHTLGRGFLLEPSQPMMPNVGRMVIAKGNRRTHWIRHHRYKTEFCRRIKCVRRSIL